MSGTSLTVRVDRVVDGDTVRVFLRDNDEKSESCLLYTSPSPRDRTRSRMPSSA